MTHALELLNHQDLMKFFRSRQEKKNYYAPFVVLDFVKEITPLLSKYGKVFYL
ncbi:MAG: hypothetical protein IE909_19030 [Campylobacterales bacterium]|nr:hypothetical protein [Campylobacterales bacterium]